MVVFGKKLMVFENNWYFLKTKRRGRGLKTTWVSNNFGHCHRLKIINIIAGQIGIFV